MLFPPGSYTPSLTSHDFAPTVFPAISCDVTPAWSGVGVTGFFFGSMSLMGSPFTRSGCTPHALAALPILQDLWRLIVLRRIGGENDFDRSPDRPRDVLTIQCHHAGAH